MRLSALDIAGFKSFARPAHLEFRDGTTAIVGPNGSGKSNIADAVRWVLGEQSMKTLRGKKSEDVIFSGSGSRGRLGMAEISLTLTADDRDDADMAELVITRQLTRSGESTYLLNRRPVRLVDVAEILARAGFGQKTYTVIGQGMADAFVNASPTERRAMFEDATGVTPLLLKKEQTERKLEQTREHLTRARDLLRELEPRLRSLKRQAARARSRQEVEAELNEAETTWFARLSRLFRAELQEADAAIRTQDGRIRDLTKRLDTLRPTGSVAGEVERLSALRAEMDRLQSEEHQILLARAAAGGTVDDTVDRAAEELYAREKEQEKLSGLLEETQGNLKTADARLRDVRTRLRKLHDDLLSTQRTPLDSAHIAKLRTQMQDILGRYDALLEHLHAADNPEEFRALRDTADEIRTLLSKTVSELKEPAPSSSLAKQDDSRSQLDTARKEEETIAHDVTRLRVDSASMETRLRLIEERIAELRRLHGHPTVLKSVSDEDRHLEDVRKELTAVRSDVQTLEASLVKGAATQRSNEEERDTIRRNLHEIEEQKHQAALTAAGTRARLEDLEREAGERLGTAFVEDLRRGSVTVSDNGEIADLERTVHTLRKKLGDIGATDESVLTEETEVETRVTTLKTQLHDLEKASTDLRDGIRELESHIHRQFTDGLRQMDDTFNTYFRQMFGGGRAGLSIVKPRPVEHALPDVAPTGEDDSSEIVEETAETSGPHTHELPAGVEIRATPPGKKLATISQLSGGEKALTSIALLFAILSQRPSPFVVLDEVDAALDEANSRRFSRMLQELAKTAQFLVITHNRATMEAAGALYGVTMGEDGVSQLLSIRLSEIPEEAMEQLPPAARG